MGKLRFKHKEHKGRYASVIKVGNRGAQCAPRIASLRRRNAPAL